MLHKIRINGEGLLLPYAPQGTKRFKCGKFYKDRKSIRFSTTSHQHPLKTCNDVLPFLVSCKYPE